MGMFDWFRRTRSPSVTQQRVDIAALRLELKELQDQFPELVTADFTTLVNRNAQGLGDFSDETSEMRALYRKYLQCEPTVKSALVGKVAAVVSNRLSASPQNDEDTQERAEADFINAAFNSVEGGISIAITHWLIAGLTDGWSISEKVWAIGEQGLLKGRWYVKALKSKDTDNLRPLTDTYRNLVGIESTKDGGQVFDPSAFLRFAYLPLFESPTGTSDLRAAVSYVQFKHQAIKLRMIYLDKFKGPFIHGEWADKNDKGLLATALEKARASGVIVTRAGTKINILDLATGGTSDFKAAIEDLDKQIVVSVHGAFLHMLEGNNKDARGSSGVQERTTKGFQWLLAEYALNAIRRDMVADMIRFNFGADRPTPMVDFEAINPEEVLKNLQIDQLLQTMGAELSKKQVYRNSGRTPPVDDADRLVPPAPPKMPGQLPTAPGGGGNVPFDPAAKFAEQPKAGSEIALAGKDGRAAAGLMQRCIDEGKAALELVTRSVAERSLNNGVAQPFTAEERKLIQDTLASTLATSELLGRSRVRERATKAEAAGGLFKLSEEIPFSTFAEVPRFGGIEPLPPVQAANYFNNLIPALNVDPRELAAAVERQAFTLSAATEDVILRRVQDSLGSNLIGGGRSGGFQAVQSILDAAGVSPANPQYSEMVYRTNMMDAYNVGHQREMQTPDMQDMFPIWQYLGIDDGRQGSDHAPKFNKYYPSSASFAEVRGSRPYNCRCTANPIDKYTWEEDLKPAGARLETSW